MDYIDCAVDNHIIKPLKEISYTARGYIFITYHRYKKTSGLQSTLTYFMATEIFIDILHKV